MSKVDLTPSTFIPAFSNTKVNFSVQLYCTIIKTKNL
jgi:hypothetical protein